MTYCISSLIYMFLFSMIRLSSRPITSFDLTGIAWTYFKLHPWLGNGSALVPLVESTRLFVVEHGDPLTRGVIQN